MKKLPHICQVYYTNGNHEQRMKENTDIYGDTYERYKAKLENCGVCFLENKAENIEKNGMKFSIYGLELDSSVNRKFKKADKISSDFQWSKEILSAFYTIFTTLF